MDSASYFYRKNSTVTLGVVVHLNRVELQDDCLSLGHANTFIPSTIGGNCMDDATGKLDPEKVKEIKFLTW